MLSKELMFDRPSAQSIFQKDLNHLVKEMKKAIQLWGGVE